MRPDKYKKFSGRIIFFLKKLLTFPDFSGIIMLEDKTHITRERKY